MSFFPENLCAYIEYAGVQLEFFSVFLNIFSSSMIISLNNFLSYGVGIKEKIHSFLLLCCPTKNNITLLFFLLQTKYSCLLIQNMFLFHRIF
jgi:hypothetical protein